MDDSRIRNKTVSFLFENGVVWTGSKILIIYIFQFLSLKLNIFASYCFNSEMKPLLSRKVSYGQSSLGKRNEVLARSVSTAAERLLQKCQEPQ